MRSNYLWDSWVYCAQALGFLSSEQSSQIAKEGQQSMGSMLTQQQWGIIRPIALEWLLGQRALQLGFITQQQLQQCFQKNVQNAKHGKKAQFFLLVDNCISQKQWQQVVSGLDSTLLQEYQNLHSYIFPSVKTPDLDTNLPSPSEVLKGNANDLELLLKKSQGEIPHRFGRYEIIKELGRGGMGKVYHAKDPKLNRDVALKVMMAGEQASPQMIKRFLQEAEATAKLSHPNIVQLYDIGIESNISFFTMAYIKGETLSSLSKQGKITQRKAVKIMVKVAYAVAEAHKHKIIHRDLKPANIMVDEKGEPKVMDFGLAKMVESDTELSRTGAVMGTPAYMPPEQAQGQVKKIDARSDVYSLGAIFYVLLTRRTLFEGENSINIILQVIEKDPIAPRVLNPDIHADLEIICLKSLEKKPIKRYQSAAALAQDLENFLQNKPISARPPRTIEKVVKWCLRHPLTATFIGVTTLMVLLILGASYQIFQSNKLLEIQKEKARTAEKKAVREKEKAEVAKEKAEEEEKNAKLELIKSQLETAKIFIQNQQLGKAAYQIVKAHKIIHSAIGKKIARRNVYLAQMSIYMQYSILPNLSLQMQERSFPPRWKISLVQGAGGSVLAVHNGGTGIDLWQNIEQMPYKCNAENAFFKFVGKTPISLSPDGKYLATCHQKNLIVYNVLSKKAFRQIQKQKISNIAISPDKKWLAAKCYQELYLLDIHSSKSYSLQLGIDDERPYPITFSKDSEFLAHGSKVDLWIWNVKTRKKDKVFSLRGQHSISALAFSPDNRFLIYGNKRGKIFIYDRKLDLYNAFPFAHEGHIKDIYFSPSGRFFATASEQGTLILWDTWSQKPLLKRFFPGSILKINFDLQDKHLMVMVWRDEDVLFFVKLKIEPNKIFQPLALPKEAQALFNNLKKSFHLNAIVNPPLVISPSGRFIASALHIPKTIVWDRRKNTTKVLTPASSPVRWMKYKDIDQMIFSRNEEKLAVGYAHNGWVIWDTNTWQKLHVFPEYRGIKFSADHRSIFFLDHPTNVLKKYDLITKKWQKIHTFHATISGFHISPSGKYIAIATSMETDIFIVKNKKLIKMDTINIGGFISDFRWNKEETLITAGNKDGRLSIWKLSGNQWQLLNIPISNLNKYITKLNFSPDGKYLAIFSQSSIVIYDIIHKQQTDAAIGYFKGEVAAFSPDWKFMVLPSFSGGFLLYDLQKNRELIHLPSDQFKQTIDKIIGRSQK